MTAVIAPAAAHMVSAIRRETCLSRSFFMVCPPPREKGERYTLPFYMIASVEVAHRVLRRTVYIHLKVQMRTGRVAGGAYQTDGLTGGYPLANRNMDGRLMAVSRHDAAAVIDNGIVAVAGNPACGGNRAGCSCYDRCAGRCRNILALVELAGTVDRMYTPAIGTRIIGVTRKRPGERAAC